MVNKCSYCGEEKLCRFNENIFSIMNLSYKFSLIGSSFNKNRIRYGEFICEDCDNYLKHKREILNKKVRKDMEKKTKEFIKERDKFLNKINR